MKLKDWANQQGVHYQTAWRWARNGKMPVPVTKTETGQYLVQVEAAGPGRPVAATSSWSTTVRLKTTWCAT